MRFLFAVRWKLGALLGWDKPSAGVGVRVASLRDRLPGDLRDAPRGPDNEGMPLKAMYELDMESARELANKTVHTVMHLGWVQGANGDYRAADGRSRQAQRMVRAALHDRHRAFPIPHRLPSPDPAMGASLARPPNGDEVDGFRRIRRLTAGFPLDARQLLRLRTMSQ